MRSARCSSDTHSRLNPANEILLKTRNIVSKRMRLAAEAGVRLEETMIPRWEHTDSCVIRSSRREGGAKEFRTFRCRN